VNRKSIKGNTALHDCAESGSLEIMKLLLASGARIDVDAYGKHVPLAADFVKLFTAEFTLLLAYSLELS
jgi:ankyrin repeat protein